MDGKWKRVCEADALESDIYMKLLVDDEQDLTAIIHSETQYLNLD